MASPRPGAAVRRRRGQSFARSTYEPSSVTFYNRKGLTDTLQTFGLRVDAIDYKNDKDRKRTDGTVVRGTFLCTKDSSLALKHPQHYWKGGSHKRWQQS